MMNEEKLLAVARYLEGDMGLQEKQEFETLIQSDPELQGLLEEYKNIHLTLKMKLAPSEEDRAVGAALQQLNQQYFKDAALTGPVKVTRVVPFVSYLKWMSVAAVLVIGLLVWAPWRANLYEQYGISKEMSVAERGEGDKNNLEKAAAFYNVHDFVAAGKILEKEYLADTDNSLIAYYYGITLIENRSEAKARTVLSKLHNGESVFKYDAAYYIALSFIKQNNYPQALVWLEKIPRDTPSYDKAQGLIKKLR